MDRELAKLNAEYVRAVEERDVAWFDRNLAPEFVNTNPDGSLVDRAAFLDQIRSGPGVSAIEAHDVVIQAFGDLGIVRARTTLRNAAGGTGRGRYTDIWLLRQGRWLCVAAHVTRL